MIVSHRKQFIYFHIPRTAGISLRELLSPYQDIGPADYINTLPAGEDPLHVNQDFAKTLLHNVDDYFEFTIVREPLDRLISMYLYGNNVSRFGSFSNFAQRMSAITADNYSRENMKLNCFFNSQLYWTTQPLTRKIHIFKFEDITKDAAPLLTDIGIDLVKLNRINEAKNSLKGSLSTKEIDFCRSFLQKEYEFLNYR